MLFQLPQFMPSVDGHQPGSSRQAQAGVPLNRLPAGKVGYSPKPLSLDIFRKRAVYDLHGVTYYILQAYGYCLGSVVRVCCGERLRGRG